MCGRKVSGLEKFEFWQEKGLIRQENEGWRENVRERPEKEPDRPEKSELWPDKGRVRRENGVWRENVQER
ncbi:hypothetical protein CEF21_04695 [Bacillus sp. FJAT-42376]|nr:hypothetical protein CEF21_04695 [Bacillus sp. FJAT-42376]